MTTTIPQLVVGHAVYVNVGQRWTIGQVDRAFHNTATVTYLDPASGNTTQAMFPAVEVFALDCYRVVAAEEVTALDALASGAVIVYTEPSREPGMVAFTLDNDAVVRFGRKDPVLIRA